MAYFLLNPDIENLQGRFSRDIPPALTIDPGDTVEFRTLDAGGHLEPRTPDREKVVPRALEGRPDSSGHCLSGPIAIRGAKPGMTLAVHVEEIEVGSWGFTSAGGWPHPCHDRLGFNTGPDALHIWTLDAMAGTGRNQFGHVVSLRPFLGVMGLAPAESGDHSTVPPRRTGGNLDCKELTAGSTLYLPIEVEGGLFSAGDGHGIQGDGELCVTAIECPMEKAVLRFELLEGEPNAPRIKTKDSWITLGLHADLQEACYLAIESMLDLMVEQYKLDRRDAYALASLVVDLRITQIVNEVRGVHAVLRNDAIKSP